MGEESKEGRLFSNRQLLALIVPLVIEQFLAVMVGMIDQVMISSVSESAMSAVSLVDNVNILLISVFAALATGGAVVAGQLIGYGDKQKACEAGEQLVVFIFLISLTVMFFFYICKGFLLYTVFGKITDSVRSQADTYLMIVTASIPFLALYNSGAALFRVQGNSAVSMIVSLLMNSINIVGNAICVYGLHMGVEGVAIPTLISRLVSAVVIIMLLRRQNLTIHISRPFHYRFQWKMVRRILQIGVPNGVENSMFQLGKIVLLSLISSFGTHAIAANAASNAIAALEILPGQAVGMALITVVSQCVGANDYKQVKYYTKKLMLLTYLFMALINLSVLIALPIVPQIMHLSAKTAAITKQLLIMHSISAIVIWPLSFTFPNTLRAASDVKYTMIVSLASMWICRIFFGILLGKYMELGVFGIWVAMILDWCVRSVLFIIRYFHGKWMQKV